MTRRQAEAMTLLQNNVIMFLVSAIICIQKPELDTMRAIIITAMCIPLNIIFTYGIIDVFRRYNMARRRG